MDPTPPPPRPRATPPGWYADPWEVAAWRWWDGEMWTVHTGGDRAHKPRLPAWLSVPVVLAAVPMVLSTVVFAVATPLAVLLGFVPLLIVVPALWWLDRVEPEPHSSLIHSLLWGAFVATFISSIVNGIVAAIAGTDFAAVVSAPLIEEATKGLGILYAVRRRELDGVMDGIVYAGWVAIGFAVVEDFQYFVGADAEDALLGVFIVRGLMTPFAHPLFSVWMGFAIGRAVERGTSVAWASAWGFGLSALTHAAWNGSLTLSENARTPVVILIAATAFVLLFISVIALLVRVRAAERRAFVDFASILVHRYGMSPIELEVFSNWKTMLERRRVLPRKERQHFDRVHAAFARLTLLHSRPGPIDTVTEARLVELLQQARAAPLR